MASSSLSGIDAAFRGEHASTVAFKGATGDNTVHAAIACSEAVAGLAEPEKRSK
jgi:hypothetical protein